MQYLLSIVCLWFIIGGTIAHAHIPDTLRVPRVGIETRDCYFGRSMVVSVAINRESNIDPQREILITCRIGSQAEAQKRFVERDAIKEQGRGSYWSKRFRFGYISAADTQIVVRVLWFRERDTLVIKTDTAKPRLKLHPRQGIWNVLHSEKTTIIPDSHRRTITLRCMVNITPRPQIPIDIQPNPRSDRYPTIVYADFSHIRITNQPGFIDYTTSSISLFAGEIRDTIRKIRLTPDNLQLLQIQPGNDSNEMYAMVELRGLPQPPDTTQIYSLRGVLALRYGYTVQGKTPNVSAELTPRRSYLRVYLPLLPDAQNQAQKPGQESEPDFIRWLNRFMSTAKLPPELLRLQTVAKRGDLRLTLADNGLIQRLQQQRFFEQSLHVGDKLYALEQDCDESSRIKYYHNHYLPIPEPLIQHSGTVDDCEQYRRLLEQIRYRRIDHGLLFTEQGQTPFSQRLLYCIPVGFETPLSLQNYVRLSVSSFPTSKPTILTTDSLATMPLQLKAREIYGHSPIADRTTRTVLQYLDTLDYERHRSPEALATLQIKEQIQQYIAWNNRKDKSLPPFRVYEADSASRLRFQEKFFPKPEQTPALVRAEEECPAAEEIKELLREGAKIPIELFEDAPNECEMVRMYYQIFQEQKVIHRVLIFVREATKNAPASMFAVLTGSIRSRESEFLKIPLWQQLKPPNRMMVITEEELKHLAARVLINDIPAKGSINTDEKTLYDYLKLHIQKNRLREITK